MCMLEVLGESRKRTANSMVAKFISLHAKRRGPVDCIVQENFVGSLGGLAPS